MHTFLHSDFFYMKESWCLIIMKKKKTTTTRRRKGGDFSTEIYYMIISAIAQIILYSYIHTKNNENYGYTDMLYTQYEVTRCCQHVVLLFVRLVVFLNINMMRFFCWFVAYIFGLYSTSLVLWHYLFVCW